MVKKYKTDKELQKAIDEYFTEVEGKKDHKPTITGLMLSLGFCDRQSFYDYEKTGKHSCTIKKARLRIEQEYEQRLHTGQPTGAIFALKNFGWVDKQEQDVTVTTGSDTLREAIAALKPTNADTD